MLSKEEFQKTFIRMMDSVRHDQDVKGEANCDFVYCCDCPLGKIADSANGSDTCFNMAYSAMDIIEIVEKWGKEHPITTNGDKFREIFGIDPLNGLKKYDGYCTAFWGSEYIPPKKEE